MRLINCKTRQLKEYFGSKIPPYAILSHTWGHEEVNFAEFTGDQAAARRKEGYTKIDFTCRQALKDNLKYAWVDTCCIDKTSSAELSEAINSMFAWYASSQICYVYFSDVLKTTLQTSFRRSRWFTRGWTLQELIAPSDVKFFDRDWDYLGTRDDLKEDIIKFTSISESALLKGAKLNYQDHRALGLGQYSVAKRMSWAAQRITTRIEDSAYCLLGIFDINMPLLYGEGSRAFIRLQQAIMQKTNDHSIFAWGFQLDSKHHLQQAREAGAMPSEYSLIDSHLLAQSPADFKKCANVERATISTAAFTMTNAGLEIEFPLVPLSNGSDFIALLNCSPAGSSDLIGIFLCSSDSDRNSDELYRAQLVPNQRPRQLCSVPVELGLAAQSETKKCTIIDGRDEEVQATGVLTKDEGFRVAVTETRCFQTMEYHIIHATTLDNIVSTTDGMAGTRNLRSDTVSWDPRTKVLTAHNDHRRDSVMLEDFCCFQFTQRHAHTNGKRDFTLVLQISHAKIALFRGLFSGINRDRILNKVGMEGKHVGEQCIAINTSGREFKIAASITHNVVYGLRIYQVRIDAVPLDKRTKRDIWT